MKGFAGERGTFGTFKGRRERMSSYPALTKVKSTMQVRTNL